VSENTHLDPKALILRLRELDVCAVSDALDRLRLPSAESGLVPLTLPRKICGPVQTVKLVSVEDSRADIERPKRHLGTTAIESAAPGTVIVVEQRSGVEASGWGGLLSLAAVRADLEAVIVDGWARDIDEATELGWPIYARAATPRTARGRVVEFATGQGIRVVNTDVHAGDFVIADRSGVAFLPRARASEIVDTAEEIAARERMMANDVKHGRPISEVMGAVYETLADPRP
jgi:4-hydroxy-4-methyl-2-oxoglutarate aldolase